MCFCSFMAAITCLSLFGAGLVLQKQRHEKAVWEARERKERNVRPMLKEQGPTQHAYVSTQVCVVKGW